MEEIITHEEKTFSGINYEQKILRNREFVQCTFVNCDFTKSDLQGNTFEDCSFKQCNFTMTEVSDTGFRNATFISCKLLGIDFSRCNTFAFSMSFSDSYLDFSVFYSMKLKKTLFERCSVKEVDFSNADLSGSVFKDCDLQLANFSGANLEKADLRTARNFSIDPSDSKIKNAKFSVMNLEGLLDRHKIIIDYNI
nr:pentapeptide repeat-containing protein [Sphingobacterium sp. lm-10]